MCVCVCRDVDDPEYKPAPALLKDDMEVRPHELKVQIGFSNKADYVLSRHKQIVFSCRMMPLPLETWLSLIVLEVSIRCW